MNKKDAEFRKELIKKRNQVELKINELRRIQLVELNLIEISDKLALLKQLYAEHRQLSGKIKTIERFA